MKALLLLLMLAGCAGEHESPRARCEKVREHLVSLQLDVDDPRREEHEKVMRRAMGDEFLSECVRSTPEARAKCILQSTTAESAMACRSPGGSPRGSK
jgi:hypothetical protein